MANYKHILSGVDQPSYKCGGGCSSYFKTVYELYDHLREHEEGGSYIYKHAIKTGFPMRIYINASTQYDLSDLQNVADNFADREATKKTIKNAKVRTRFGFQNSKHGAIDANKRNKGKRLLTAETNTATIEREIDEELDTYLDNSDDSNAITTSDVEPDYITNVPEERVKCEMSDKQCSDDPLPQHTISSAQDKDIAINDGTGNIGSEVCIEGHVAELNVETYEDVKPKLNGIPFKRKCAYKSRGTLNRVIDEDVKQMPDVVKQKTKEKAYTMHINQVSDFTVVKEIVKKHDKDKDREKRTKIIKKSKRNTKLRNRISESEPKVSCEICDKQISAKGIGTHLRKIHGIQGKPVGRHKGSYFFSCEDCGKLVSSRDKAQHNKLHHPDMNQGTEMCETCGRVFMTSIGLKQHKKVHVDTNLACNFCEFIAISKSKLCAHKEKHFKTECAICGQMIIRKEYNYHVRNVHMGEKRYSCELCTKSFYKKCGLVEHRMIHFEPTISCHFCERKFASKRSKNRHERIHTGDKRYSCHICNRGFIQSTPYWIHMEKHHSLSKQEAMALRQGQSDGIKETIKSEQDLR